MTFRILATAAQRSEIERDMREMMAALEGALDAELSVRSGLVPDPELLTTWVELFGEVDSADAAEDAPEGAELVVEVRRYDIGSVSGLTMNFAELLTVREKESAEPLVRQIRDDAGTPRVPWHVEVRP